MPTPINSARQRGGRDTDATDVAASAAAARKGQQAHLSRSQIRTPKLQAHHRARRRRRARAMHAGEVGELGAGAVVPPLDMAPRSPMADVSNVALSAASVPGLDPRKHPSAPVSVERVSVEPRAQRSTDTSAPVGAEPGHAEPGHATRQSPPPESSGGPREEAQTTGPEGDRSVANTTPTADKATEWVDRSLITRNAEGSEEAHSDVPELWNIDGCEMDLSASYKVGGQMWYRPSVTSCSQSELWVD